eukprot:3456122-Prymnesium_polylepis.1
MQTTHWTLRTKAELDNRGQAAQSITLAWEACECQLLVQLLLYQVLRRCREEALRYGRRCAIS